MSTFADSNRYIARVLKEEDDAWGVTPASGTVREARLTSSSLTASKDTVVSDEIRADRMVSNIIEVQAASAGDISIEFSAGSNDDFLEAFVLGAWTRPMTFDRFEGEQVSVTGNNTVAVQGGDFTNYFTAGRRIKTEGFVNPANNGYLQVSSVAHSGGVTTVTVGGTGLVAEDASRFTRVMDANDVIVLNSTAIAAVSDGFEATGVFASAVAAGQLVAGQRIFVEGLGFETGNVAFSDTAAEGETVTVNDGTNTFTYTFSAASADAAAAADLVAAAAQAEHAAGRLNVKATAATGTVTFVNLNGKGGTVSTDAANGTATNFTGGVSEARGFFTISAVSDDKITTNEATGTVSAGAKVTVKGSMLRNPGDIDNITPQSFTIEEHYTDIGQVFLRDGLRVGSFNEEVSSGAIVTGSFSFQGRESKRLTASKLGAAPYTQLAATTTEVINATTNVGSIFKDGSKLSTAVQSISMTGEANLRAQNAVGSKFARGIGTGRFNLTGTVTAYFETGEMYDHFVNHDTVGLAWDFKDLDGNTYWTTVPAVKFTSDDITPGGIDQDVLEPLEFTAQRDPATNCMFQRDRFSSTTAPTA